MNDLQHSILEMSKDQLTEVYELANDLNNSHNAMLLDLYNKEAQMIYGEKVPFLTVVQLNEIVKVAEKEASIRYFGNGRY